MPPASTAGVAVFARVRSNDEQASFHPIEHQCDQADARRERRRRRHVWRTSETAAAARQLASGRNSGRVRRYRPPRARLGGETDADAAAGPRAHPFARRTGRVSCGPLRALASGRDETSTNPRVRFG
jgi:hypothetical protein